MTSPFLFNDCARLAEFTLRHRMPSVFAFREWVDAGGLLSYGPSRQHRVQAAGAGMMLMGDHDEFAERSRSG